MLTIKKVSMAVKLDTRHSRKDGTFAIKLRITHKQKQKYYPLQKWATEEEWETTFRPETAGKLKKLRRQLDNLQEKAENIIEEMPYFSFEGFERSFNDQEESSRDMMKHLDSYQDELRKEGSIVDIK